MAVHLKVLTLNCWGIPLPRVCRNRTERIAAIGQELSKGEYDIVLLQEIWSQSDYDKLCAKLLTVLPHTHYFYSGVVGSGVCVFSKYVILETLMHTFTANGYPHKINHGDWYGSKMVGLTKILYNDLRVNVYATHTHAQYNETTDMYAAHRVLQAFEMSQFIKHTSETCDIVITGGDFNFQPSQLGYKIIVSNANLLDSWIKQKTCCEHIGTSACGTNSFTTQFYGKDHSKSKYRDGKCIDFLLYRSNAGYSMSCEKCYLTMQKMPNSDINYSDHEGVAAIFTIKRIITALPQPRDTGEIEQRLLEAVSVLEQGQRKVKSNQVFSLVALIICVFTTVFISNMSLPFGLDYALVIIRCILMCSMAFLVWSIVIMAKQESNALTACCRDINNVIRSNSP